MTEWLCGVKVFLCGKRNVQGGASVKIKDSAKSQWAILLIYKQVSSLILAKTKLGI